MIILERETKDKFGYEPSKLRPSSEKLVVCMCEHCSNILERKFRMAKRNKLCLKCSNKVNANTSLEQRGENMKTWHSKNLHPRLGKISHGKRGIYAGIFMRSSWEIAVAKYFDSKGITWQYEPRAFPIIVNGKNYTYTPDFYLPIQNCYIEVKGYWRDNAREKFEQFEKDYLQINIKIWNKQKLKDLKII
jgi:hypothetical protein